MRIKQVSVFVGNETGRLVDMLTPLARSKIDILALSVADSADFGIVRLVVSNPEGAAEALHEAGFTLRVDEVLYYQVPDVPGGLLRTVVEPLARAGINLEYFYAFIQSQAGKATVVCKVSDLEGAEATLKRLQQ